jgi:hypothetical protein
MAGAPDVKASALLRAEAFTPARPPTRALASEAASNIPVNCRLK